MLSETKRKAPASPPIGNTAIFSIRLSANQSLAPFHYILFPDPSLLMIYIKKLIFTYSVINFYTPDSQLTYLKPSLFFQLLSILHFLILGFLSSPSPMAV